VNQDVTDPAPNDDLAQLRLDWPGYSIGRVWTAVNSGPDKCRFVAVKGEIMLSAWTAAGLDGEIRREEG
jgi:hypothetical protein